MLNRHKVKLHVLFHFVVDRLCAFFWQDITLRKIRGRKGARFRYSPRKIRKKCNCKSNPNPNPNFQSRLIR